MALPCWVHGQTLTRKRRVGQGAGAGAGAGAMEKQRCCSLPRQWAVTPPDAITIHRHGKGCVRWAFSVAMFLMTSHLSPPSLLGLDFSYYIPSQRSRSRSLYFDQSNECTRADFLPLSLPSSQSTAFSVAPRYLDFSNFTTNAGSRPTSHPRRAEHAIPPRISF